MRKKILLILLTLNTILIINFIFPFSELFDILKITKCPEAGAIGIIGGADGPTAIFISAKLSFGIILHLLCEAVLIGWLIMIRSKK